MFRKNNKQAQLESSESSMSSENEEGTHKINQQSPNEYEEDGQSRSEDEMSDDQAEEEAKPQGKGSHLKAPHESESESEDEEEEEDSLDDGDTYFRSRQNRNGIHTIREDPKESLEDDSIDHIEQRIKKLQKDLETRLNKHKEKPEEKNHGKIVSKASAHPPMPQKKTPNQETENKMSFGNQVTFKNDAIQQKKPEIRKVSQPLPPVPIAMPKQKKAKKDQNPQIRQSKVESKHSQGQKKVKPKKQEAKEDQKNHQFFNDAPVNQELQQKLNEMTKAMKQLRLENQILKQKLESEKMKKEKSKNKTLESLEKIKQASDLAGGSKLEKEIELLEVIQKLQVKLKKSIARKMAKQSNAASSLPHKGLPTAIQSHF